MNLDLVICEEKKHIQEKLLLYLINQYYIMFILHLLLDCFYSRLHLLHVSLYNTRLCYIHIILCLLLPYYLWYNFLLNLLALHRYTVAQIGWDTVGKHFTSSALTCM